MFVFFYKFRFIRKNIGVVLYLFYELGKGYRLGVSRFIFVLRVSLEEVCKLF